MADLTLKVSKTIKRLCLMGKGASVIASVSGGADSCVMLYLLNSLKEELSFQLTVFHLNHNLRGAESRRDYEFVRGLARGLGLRFIGKTLRKGELKKPGVSPQEAARKRRYEMLEAVLRQCKADRVCLGHTLDDQAETVLMRLMKGTSLTGLCGIPPERGPYVRPLIEVSRAEVEEFARLKGIKYVVDSTNLIPKYLRNDIRLNLIPFLKKMYNPNLIETLGKVSAVLRQDDAFIEKAAIRAYPFTVIKKTKTSVFLSRERLLRTDRAVSSRVFLKACRELKGTVELLGPHILSFHSVVENKRPSAAADLAEGLRVVGRYAEVVITVKPAEKARPFDKPLKIPGITGLRSGLPEGYSLKASLIKGPLRPSKGEKAAFFDYEALKGLKLRVRSFRPGDRLIPFGMEGHKKLKEVFIDAKIPMQDRPKVPLLTAKGEILWAAGVRRSALFPVIRSTKTVLKLEMVPPAEG